jgi:hypothetical protein
MVLALEADDAPKLGQIIRKSDASNSVKGDDQDGGDGAGDGQDGADPRLAVWAAGQTPIDVAGPGANTAVTS